MYHSRPRVGIKGWLPQTLEAPHLTLLKIISLDVPDLYGYVLMIDLVQKLSTYFSKLKKLNIISIQLQKQIVEQES